MILRRLNFSSCYEIIEIINYFTNKVEGKSTEDFCDFFLNLFHFTSENTQKRLMTGTPKWLDTFYDMKYARLSRYITERNFLYNGVSIEKNSPHKGTL